jgi:hypothetical protein
VAMAAFHGRISLEDNMIRKNYNIPDFCTISRLKNGIC